MLRNSEAHEIAQRHLLVKRIAAQYLAAKKTSPVDFDKSKGDKTVRNPLTDRLIKLKSLKRHSDPKLRAMWQTEYDKWKDDPEEAEKPSSLEVTRKALDKIFTKAKGVSASMKSSLSKAPENVQRLVTDKAFRDKTLKEAGKALKAGLKSVGKKIKDSFVGEAKGVFKDTPKALYDIAKKAPGNAKALNEWRNLPKEERITANLKEMMDLPSKDQMMTIYGTAVYAGGVALAVAAPGVGTGAAAAIKVGAPAFVNSFFTHVAIKSVATMAADQGFLGYELAETGIGVAGELGIEVAALPSSAALYKALPWNLISSLVASSKADPTKGSHDLVDGFIDNFLDSMSKVLDAGISDKEMENILQENTQGAFA